MEIRAALPRTANEGIEVGPAVPDDAPAIAALLAEAHPGAWTAETLLRELARADALAAVARVSGQLAAIALGRAAADELSVLDVATSPDCRRRGLARCLVAWLLDAAARRGCRIATLELRESNGAARALYAGAGFVVVGRRPRYYPGGEAAALMSCTLDAAGTARGPTAAS